VRAEARSTIILRGPPGWGSGSLAPGQPGPSRPGIHFYGIGCRRWATALRKAGNASQSRRGSPVLSAIHCTNFRKPWFLTDCILIHISGYFRRDLPGPDRPDAPPPQSPPASPAMMRNRGRSAFRASSRCVSSIGTSCGGDTAGRPADIPPPPPKEGIPAGHPEPTEGLGMTHTIWGVLCCPLPPLPQWVTITPIPPPPPKPPTPRDGGHRGIVCGQPEGMGEDERNGESDTRVVRWLLGGRMGGGGLRGETAAVRCPRGGGE